MIEYIIEALFTPGRVWMGTVIGIIVALCAYYFLPDGMDKHSIAAWSIGIGFIGGLVLSFPFKGLWK